MIIIGLLGHSGVGKDTMADYMVRKYNFIKMSFADPLKRCCHDMLSIPEEYLWGASERRNTKLPTGFTPREALQKLGDWGRALYPEAWIVKLLKDAQQVMNEVDKTYFPTKGVADAHYWVDHPSGIVVADVRYQNEMDAIKQLKPHLALRLKRKGFEGVIAGGVEGHSSEEGQKKIPDDYFDAVIDVIEGIPNYYKQIDQFLPGLLKGAT